MDCTVKIDPQGKQLCVPAKTNLLDALRMGGFPVAAPCGGKGTCGKCRVTVDGVLTQACSYTIDHDITVNLPAAGNDKILMSGTMEKWTADPAAPGNLVAVDIGTTTVVCSLMDSTGRELAVKSMANPQSAWGADVISRIQHGQKGQGSALTEAIRQGLQELLRQCCAAAETTPEDIGLISIVGNSCMQQLFFGMEVANLAAAPFAPAIRKAEMVPALPCFSCCPKAKMLILPDIAGFVGADTLGCILAAGLHDTKDTVLLVDIGTNGELVLAHEGKLSACSTAAGPALEGGNISCGMRAASGAIDRVWSDGFHVIDGGAAKGICGSGLVDAAAMMLEEEIINFRGRIQTPDHTYCIAQGVTLNQDDIRQLQMAKGAIAAGIRLLAEHRGLSLDQIDRVILAGAFGSFLDIANACRIGLIPAELESKIVAAGNIALSGARALAMDKKLLPLAQNIVENTEAVELAALPEFAMTFAENMLFLEE